MDDLMSTQAAITYLKDAANYFVNRDTRGEDANFWANVQNAENCRRIARLIEALDPGNQPAFETITEEELLRGLEHRGLVATSLSSKERA
jgi:hypothetical protein